jgi:hypothetical protein
MVFAAPPGVGWGVRLRCGAQTAAVRIRTPLAAVLVAAAALTAWPGRALAQASLVLLPAGPLHADTARPVGMALLPLDGGGRVASPAAVTVTAARGVVLTPPARGPDGLWRFTYRPPAVTAKTVEIFTVRAGALERRLEVPLLPWGRTTLAVQVKPSPLVLGRDGSAEVRIRVADAAGKPAPAGLRLSASTGVLGRVKEVAPGDYAATYRPPREKYPQVALILALSVADGAFATHALPLHAAIVVPGEGEPGGQMRIVVDGRTFGPAKVNERGQFKLPIVVPPGGRAVGVMTDAAGNTRQREIDLKLPAFKRVVAAALPAELAAGAGSRTEILASVVDARGRPARGPAPPMRAERGTLGNARRRPDGSFVAEYAAPRELGAGTVEVIVGGPGGTDRVRVSLRPGPPDRLTVTAPADGFVADGVTPQAVRVEVRDAAGNPIDDARLAVSLPHARVAAVREQGGGRYEVLLVPPPDPGPGRAPLSVEVTSAPPGPPRHLALRPVGKPGPRGLEVEAWVDDDFGNPVPAAGVVVRHLDRLVRGVTDAYGVVRDRFAVLGDALHVDAHLAEVPAIHATLDLRRTADGWRAFAQPEARTPPKPASARVEVALRPPLPVDLLASVTPPGDLAAGATARLLVRTRDPRGAPLRGLKLLGRAAGASLGPDTEPEPGLHAFSFTAPKPGRYLVSVTEPRSQVTAVVAVTVK